MFGDGGAIGSLSASVRPSRSESRRAPGQSTLAISFRQCFQLVIGIFVEQQRSVDGKDYDSSRIVGSSLINASSNTLTRFMRVSVSDLQSHRARDGLTPKHRYI